MAFGFFLNMEILDIKIIKESIGKMSNNNVTDIGNDEKDILNEEMINNLHYGAIACVFMTTLYETALNTIISKRLECMDEDILKASHNMKLHMICFECHIAYSDLISDNSYSIIKEISKVRNDIVHYKTNYINEGSWIHPTATFSMGSSKKSIADIFTKDSMQHYFDGVMQFLNLICNKCGFQLNDKCEVFDCDGRDSNYEFICDIFDESDY